MSCDYVKVLDLAKEGKLQEAHKIVQKYSNELSCLIHAYIHRVEGDLSNANYWYRRVGIKKPSISLEEELQTLYSKAQES